MRTPCGFIRLIVTIPLCGLMTVLTPGEASDDGVGIEFNRDIRPILAGNCFACHGPDARARKAGLRLDVRDDAIAAAIAPGDADASRIVERITHDEPGMRMPPPESGKALSDGEIDLIRKWIAEGALYERHWSFVPPSKPALPEVRDLTWPRNPIDRFVLARLEREQLRPSREAGRRTLLRRVTLDLTGLPPTPEEIDAYVSDDSPDAYEQVVSRLLASPHFGERMAVLWLDLARYSDTNGYSIDGGRHMWAWRDWVIGAFNDNMPFDEFTIEQLAGDLLPNASTSQRIASGFNRNHMNTHEGGTIEEEYRVAYVVDRVKTTAQAWMGLTMACAQCHDHKYDPISQEEYYRFFAFFNTITDRGNDGNGGINSVPFIPVYSEEQERNLAALSEELSALRKRLLAPNEEIDRAQRSWEDAERQLDRTPPALGSWQVAGPFTAASGAEAFATEFGPETAKSDVRWLTRDDLEDGKPHPLSGANRAWYFRRTITTRRSEPIEFSLGSDDAIKVWWNGEVALENNTQRGVAPDQERLTVRARAGDNTLVIKIVNYGGPAGFYFDLLRSGPPPEITAIIAGDFEARSKEESQALRGYYRSIAPALEPLRKEIEGTEAKIAEIKANPVTTAMIMEEMAAPRETFLLERGRYDLRGEMVSPDTPGCLPPLPATAERPNRLTLAQWLVDPAHPLTARVAVNLYWQMLFGTGLVKTSEDFGTQGERPSHPELLDWVAVEFIESGWDIKHMLRLMVTSATYRQESTLTDEMLERDPGNRLLARGPRFRLDAEFVRDTALAASGLLVDTVGGPSVRPYQPDGLWKEMSHFGSTPATEQVYTQDSGEKLYRRSLYTIHKRTVPPPPMVAFDAPNREVCTVRRARTNTPLQALVLLNETGFVEAARGLAQRMIKEGGGAAAERIRFGFILVASREPTDHELSVLIKAHARELARFRDNPDDALELLKVGESPRDDSLDPVEHAAWTVIANLLLNLSETVTKG